MVEEVKAAKGLSGVIEESCTRCTHRRFEMHISWPTTLDVLHTSSRNPLGGCGEEVTVEAATASEHAVAWTARSNECEAVAMAWKVVATSIQARLLPVASDGLGAHLSACVTHGSEACPEDLARKLKEAHRGIPGRPKQESSLATERKRVRLRANAIPRE